MARRECAPVGSRAVLPAIDDRIDGPIDGVDRGVRSLAFGLVTAVDHTVARARDGPVTSRPNVSVEEPVTVAPRSVAATVVLEGREYTRDVPVVVRRGETQSL